MNLTCHKTDTYRGSYLELQLSATGAGSGFGNRGETGELSLSYNTVSSPCLLPSTQCHLPAEMPDGAKSLATDTNLAVQPVQGILREVPYSCVSITPPPCPVLMAPQEAGKRSSTNSLCTRPLSVQERLCHCYTSTVDLCLVLVLLGGVVLNQSLEKSHRNSKHI